MTADQSDQLEKPRDMPLLSSSPDLRHPTEHQRTTPRPPCTPAPRLPVSAPGRAPRIEDPRRKRALPRVEPPAAKVLEPTRKKTENSFPSVQKLQIQTMDHPLVDPEKKRKSTKKSTSSRAQKSKDGASLENSKSTSPRPSKSHTLPIRSAICIPPKSVTSRQKEPTSTVTSSSLVTLQKRADTTAHQNSHTMSKSRETAAPLHHPRETSLHVATTTPAATSPPASTFSPFDFLSPAEQTPAPVFPPLRRPLTHQPAKTHTVPELSPPTATSEVSTPTTSLSSTPSSADPILRDLENVMHSMQSHAHSSAAPISPHAMPMGMSTLAWHPPRVFSAPMHLDLSPSPSPQPPQFDTRELTTAEVHASRPYRELRKRKDQANAYIDTLLREKEELRAQLQNERERTATVLTDYHQALAQLSELTQRQASVATVTPGSLDLNTAAIITRLNQMEAEKAKQDEKKKRNNAAAAQRRFMRIASRMSDSGVRQKDPLGLNDGARVKNHHEYRRGRRE